MKKSYHLIIAVLIAVLIVPNFVSACEEESSCECQGSQYPIMHPDPETLNEWVECYNRAPNAYIDPQLEPPKGYFSLLDHLDYIPVERNQGYCGNCWVWAGTGVLEIALDVQEGFFDRLSIQYLNSKYHGGAGSDWACCGGWLDDLANFYSREDFAIPWSNTNAAWADYTQSCGHHTTVPWETIATSPNYPINTCTPQSITTHEVGQATAIANIKNVLAQGKAVWFSYFLPTGDDWDQFFDFWDFQEEDDIWNPDYSCGHVWESGVGGGHAVLVVGYDDTDPDNPYWIVVNSWGTTSGRPKGIFHLDMDMSYDCYFYDPWPYSLYSFYWETLDVTFNIGRGLVTISTDKEIYEPGDTMLVTIGLRNNGAAVDVVFIGYLWLPDNDYWHPIKRRPLSLPAGCDKTFSIPLTIGEWGGTTINAYWVVALRDPSSVAFIDIDHCYWVYQPTTGPPTSPEDFAEHVAKAAENARARESL